MRIVPAVLTSSTDELIRQLEYISEFTDEVDIDIMDGQFVTDKSITITDISPTGALIFNFDLMVQKPEEYIEQILKAKNEKKLNLGRIFVHIESEYDLKNLVEKAKDNFILGFSLQVPTAAENFLDVLKKVQTLDSSSNPPLSLKTVQIGKQGNPYHPEVLAKIQKVRQAGYNGDIYLDGGIDPDVIMSVRNSNVAGVSVGSYISRSSDPMKAYNNLREATWKKSLD